jgi:putative peptidoglycan lipid II flippase
VKRHFFALLDRLAPNQRQLLYSVGLVSALCLFVKLIFVVKDIYTSRLFGAGQELDAFLIVLAVLLFTLSIVAQSFAGAFTPTFIEVHEIEGHAKAAALIRSTSARVLILLGGLTAALCIGAVPLFTLLTHGFNERQLHLTVDLARILFLILPIAGMSVYWGTILNSQNSLRIVAIAPATIPVAMLIALIVFAPTYGITAMAWGTVAGYGFEFFVLMVAMQKHHWPILPTLKRHTHGHRVTRQYLTLLIGAALMSSSTIIDQTMASGLGSGSVSILNYGNKTVNLLLGTVSIGLMTVALPHFSRLVIASNRAGIEQVLKSLIKLILATMLPLIAALIFFSRPIVAILFQSKAIPETVIDDISLVQIFYLLQVPFYIVGTLGARLLNTLNGNHVLLRNSVINVVCNIVGNLIFIRWFGVCGIAISTSCMYIVSTLLIYHAVHSKLRQMRPICGTPQAATVLAA